MNTHFHHPRYIGIFLGSRKDFQMIQNRTVVSTILMSKLDSRGGSQVLSRIGMLKLHHLFSLPVRSLANNSPIISTISIHLSISKATHFLLSRQGRLHFVRMQILEGFQMRKSNDTTALNRLGHTTGTRRLAPPNFSIVGSSHVPQGVRGRGTRHGRHDLLPAASAQLLFFARQEIFRLG
jgi:hypothetical protein